MFSIQGLTTENIITILGMIISIFMALIAAIYKIVTNTKKYELTENYRIELLNWYKYVIQIMIDTIHFCESEDFDKSDFRNKKIDILSKLSSSIEVSRFYFPNVIKNDGYGKNKPSAYQGYRQMIVELLTYFYSVASDSMDNKNIDLMWNIEKQFTSLFFDVIDPRRRNKDYSKHIALTISEGQSIRDFVEEFPEKMELLKS